MKTEVKIGLIVAATLVLVYWGINFLKGKNVLKRSDVYYAVYDDIAGLGSASPVMLKGFKVGLITDIGFKKGSTEEIVVSFTVDHSLKIPKGSKAEIYSADLLGSKALQIIPAQNDSYYEFGDTLTSSMKPDMISDLSNEIIPIANKLDTAINSINILLDSLLDQSSVESFKNSLSNLEEISESLNNQIGEDEIAKTLKSIEEFTMTLNQNKEKIDAIITNIQTITDSTAKSNIAEMVNSANKSFSEASILLDNINSGKGTLGQLSVNEALYSNLNSSIESLNNLLIDLNENPGRYVKFSLFGGKEKKE
jgi:phospholipid/cholesterol/gamma-HCH transport system substrate-binding protein